MELLLQGGPLDGISIPMGKSKQTPPFIRLGMKIVGDECVLAHPTEKEADTAYYELAKKYLTQAVYVWK